MNNQEIDYKVSYEQISAAYEALVRDLKACDVEYIKAEDRSELVLRLTLDKNTASAKKSCIMQALKKIIL